MTASLGFVVRVGEGFVGAFEGSPQLHLFGTIDRASVWASREQAEEISDAVFGGLICGVGFGDRARIRVVSMAETLRLSVVPEGA